MSDAEATSVYVDSGVDIADLRQTRHCHCRATGTCCVQFAASDTRRVTTGVSLSGNPWYEKYCTENLTTVELCLLSPLYLHHQIKPSYSYNFCRPSVWISLSPARLVSLRPIMFSQKVWKIEELVRPICSHTLKYRVQEYRQECEGHNGLVLNPESRRTLARCILYLNRSISRIAVEFLWKELSTLEPLCALLPLDYYQKVARGGSGYVSCLYRCTH